MIIGLKGDPDAFRGLFTSKAGRYYRTFGRYAPGRFTLITLSRRVEEYGGRIKWVNVPTHRAEFHRIAAEIKEKLDE